MWRRLASRLHLYIGLTTGLVYVFIGLTGSVLVFRHEIDGLLYPGLFHVEPAGEFASVEAVVGAVRAVFPEMGITRLELPIEDDDPYEAILADGRVVYVDPFRAQVLGSHGSGETLTGWLFNLHVMLLAGEHGKTLVGFTGLALLVLGITGLILWWRGWRNLRSGLVVRWQAKARVANFDLHRVLGFYTLLPLFVIAFTGAGLIFFNTFNTAIHGLTGTPLPPAPPRVTPTTGSLAPLDSIITRAQRALPDARAARIDFPAAPGAAYRVRLRMPGELHPIGLSMVYVNPFSGRVLSAENALQVPVARKLGYLYYPLHIGSYGGIGVRVLYGAFGLVPVILAVTGFIYWLGRKRRWKRRKTIHTSIRSYQPEKYSNLG